MNLYLPPDYISRTVPQPFPDIDDGLSWQQAVYDAARQDYRGGLVVDIGCGRARKLCASWAPGETLGYDTLETVTWLQAHHADRRWKVANLESDILDLPTETTTVICADVVEHLVDPLPLMKTLARAHKQGAKVFLSTPDRVEEHGFAHRGPPPNTAHVREWSLSEFKLFCAPYLGTGDYLLVPSHDTTSARKTVLAIWGGDNTIRVTP